MTPVLRHQNQTLYVDNSQLQQSAVSETYLTAATTGGSSTTLTVPNILGFAINQILLIEDFGAENAEIVLTHASTPPSMTSNVGTITLTGALVKSHPVGSKVRVIPYDQIEFKRHTSNASGSATALTVATTANFNPPSSLGSGLVAVNPTMIVQSHESSEHTSGYYFARYKNSITSDFSNYTDGLIFGGWATNSVGYMIDRALADLSLTLGNVITRQQCYAWLNECLKMIQGKQVRWPGLFEYNYIAGQTSRGVNTVTLPTNAYDTETNRSVLKLRLGDNPSLTYVDPADFEERVGYVATGVTSQAIATDTSLNIDNSYDFADSGSVNIYVSGTKYNITYTGVTRSSSAGVLTGIPASGDGSITTTIAAGTKVWQEEEEGRPLIYTVRDGVIEFYPLADASYDNLNITLDYALVVTDINSDGDTIDFQRFDALTWYLKWRMHCAARNNGTLDTSLPSYEKYREAYNDFIRTSPVEVQARRAPRINTMNRPGTSWRNDANTSTDA